MSRQTGHFMCYVLQNVPARVFDKNQWRLAFDTSSEFEPGTLTVYNKWWPHEDEAGNLMTTKQIVDKSGPQYAYDTTNIEVITFKEYKKGRMVQIKHGDVLEWFPYSFYDTAVKQQ